jgi:hypothetical protein
LSKELPYKERKSDEVISLGSQEKTSDLGSEKVYAPSIVKAVLRAKEHQRFTAQEMAHWCNVPLKQVQSILNQLVKDDELHIVVHPGRKTSHYWWFSGYKQLKLQAQKSKGDWAPNLVASDSWVMPSQGCHLVRPMSRHHCW